MIKCVACGKHYNRFGLNLSLCLRCYEIYNVIKIKYLSHYDYGTCIKCNKVLNRYGHFCIKCSRQLGVTGSSQSYKTQDIMQGGI